TLRIEHAPRHVTGRLLRKRRRAGEQQHDRCAQEFPSHSKPPGKNDATSDGGRRPLSTHVQKETASRNRRWSKSDARAYRFFNSSGTLDFSGGCRRGSDAVSIRGSAEFWFCKPM